MINPVDVWKYSSKLRIHFLSFISQVIRLIDNILAHFIFVLAQNATEPAVNATEPATTEAATQPSTGSVAVNATEGATTEPPPDSK